MLTTIHCEGNYIGNNDWSLALEWSGKDDFNAAPLEPIYLSEDDKKADKQAGEFRSAGLFNFAIINEAGHFVPTDQPKAALAMFESYVFRQKLSDY